jgi:hypothetical protein
LARYPPVAAAFDASLVVAVEAILAIDSILSTIEKAP